MILIEVYLLCAEQGAVQTLSHTGVVLLHTLPDEVSRNSNHFMFVFCVVFRKKRWRRRKRVRVSFIEHRQ